MRQDWKILIFTPNRKNFKKYFFSKPVKKIYEDAVDMIGNTPVVRLNKIPKSEGVKCEIGKNKF